MRNFQGTFETRKQSCVSAFSIYKTVLLNEMIKYSILSIPFQCVIILNSVFFLSYEFSEVM